MNQTKKRLAIIKLAISMTDTETIQLQVLKLGLLKTDRKMRDILSLLNEQNYAQAQRLISVYIETPTETTIVQRTSQDERMTPTPPPTDEEAMIERKETPSPQHTYNDEKPLTLKEKIQQAKDQAIIEQFELFSETPSEDTEENTQVLDDYDAFLDVAPKPKKMSTETVNYDALLNVDAKDVLPDNIELKLSEDPKDTFFQEELHIIPAVEDTTQNNFFNTDDEEISQEEPIEEPIIEQEVEEKPIEEPTITDDESLSDDVEEKDMIEKDTLTYKAISYIDQKFKNMQNQYPPIHQSKESFSSVDAWLIKISKDGYTAVEIEEMIKDIDKRTETNKSEAAQLLLIAASTETKYAQFRLARALYKGILLQKNPSEAFTLINRLAMNDNYPEALCDLAQFFENGMGITKDKKRAEALYKEAMDLGVHRAMDHYERIRKQNKGLLSLFKNN